jgi:hypothetical protein
MFSVLVISMVVANVKPFAGAVLGPVFLLAFE